MRLLQSQCSTVRHEMTEAVSSYEEKPREQWLFDFPAQVALCGTQIWWTTEVNIAFARLEEGYENALKDYNKKQVRYVFDLLWILVVKGQPRTLMFNKVKVKISMMSLLK